MELAFKKKLVDSEVKVILSDPFLRLIFFKEYNFFNSDKNKGIYSEFILETLKNSRDPNLISDVLYLSIRINFFSSTILNIVKKRLASRQGYLIKIACLDYLRHFKEFIKPIRYLNLNKQVFTITRNPIVKLQSAINLLNSDEVYFQKIIDILKKSKFPTNFYRLATSEVKLKKTFRQQLKKIIIDKEFGSKVEEELLEYLK